jgi:hypothetical protein
MPLPAPGPVNYVVRIEDKIEAVGHKAGPVRLSFGQNAEVTHPAFLRQALGFLTWQTDEVPVSFAIRDSHGKRHVSLAAGP